MSCPHPQRNRAVATQQGPFLPAEDHDHDERRHENLRGERDRRNPESGATATIVPLAWATMQGDPAIVRAVLGAGGEAQETDDSGDTSLHVAASCLPQPLMGVSMAGG